MLLKSDLDFQQTHLCGLFVGLKLVLSCSFRCDQIHGRNRYDFGHTLLCFLSPTKMFNKPTSVAGLLDKSSRLAPAFGVTKFIIEIDMILATLCCAT